MHELCELGQLPPPPEGQEVTLALRLVPQAGGGDEPPPVEAWEIQMRGAGRSECTVSATLGALSLLERHAGKPIHELTPIDVSRFLARPDLKQTSRASYFGAIRRFYKWWGTNGGVDITARLPSPKLPKGTPRPISDQQLRDLLSTRMRHRTRVMILLAALAGLRAHEIAKVRGEDVDPVARTLRVIGKGNVTVDLPLHPLLADEAARMPRKGWWFPQRGRPGEHILTKSISDIVGRTMDRAGIPAGTTHRLRHWYGTTLVGDGADLRTAQTLLRHANLNTTAIYVAVRDEKRAEAIDRLDPFG